MVTMWVVVCVVTKPALCNSKCTECINFELLHWYYRGGRGAGYSFSEEPFGIGFWTTHEVANFT